MSEQQNYGFGKFVPGFDFLQNLAKGASQSQPGTLPGLSSWVAPTLNVEELDKRIGELKAVSFWLDQNAKALAATIQALELQKMTLATLKGMNFNMADVANALKLQPGGGTAPAAAAPAPASGQAGDGSVAGAAREAVSKARARKKSGAAAGGDGQGGASSQAAAGVVDPMQWWGALTQQFQEIATGALRDAAKHPAGEAVREMAGGVSGKAMQAATEMASAFTAAPRKAGAAGKKTAGKKPAAKAARQTGARGR